jgi:hypothetical protein
MPERRLLSARFGELRHGEVCRKPILAPSHRLQHFLWAVEALNRGVPYLRHYGLWSILALGAGGFFLLVAGRPGSSCAPGTVGVRSS